MSVMLIESDTLNIVPRGGLMAEKALAYLCLRYTRGRHGHHLEMHHEMTGRGLVALGTVL